MLIGDVLIAARDQFPDPCSVMGAPSAAPGLAAANTLGGSIPNATNVFVQVTALNQWGETTVSPEASVLVNAPNNSVVVTLPSSMPPGFSGAKAYFGLTTQQENGFVASQGAGNITILAVGGAGLSGGFSPLASSAFLPDTDGSDISAGQMYRWLNDGIQEASRICGGILDKTGIQAIANQADYVVPFGPWVNLDDVWFDGYYLRNIRRAYRYERINTTGISYFQANSAYADRMVVTLYLTPNRTGGTTTLANAMAATDSTIVCNNLANFLTKAPGMVQIDNEVISYTTTDSANPNQLDGCVRGYCGTTPVAHAINATVTELNIRFAGYRQPNLLSFGNATGNLPLPPGWAQVLQDYLLFRYAKFEQDKASAQAHYQDFLSRLKEINGAGYRKVSEIGPPDWAGPLYPGTPFGVIKT